MENSKKLASQDPDYELWQLLANTRYWIAKARQKELRPYGISSRHAHVLFAIHTLNNYAKLADISRAILREPQTTTLTLRRMLKKGLIKKDKGRERKKTIRFSLTEKGQEALNNSLKRETFHRAWTVLSGAEQQRLQTYLKRVLEHSQKL